MSRQAVTVFAPFVDGEMTMFNFAFQQWLAALIRKALMNLKMSVLQDALSTGSTMDQAALSIKSRKQQAAALYAKLEQDVRFRHYVQIPDHICGSLKYFPIKFDYSAVHDRLYAYYFYIGVVDDVIDRAEVDEGQSVLRQLIQTARDPTIVWPPTPVSVVTERLAVYLRGDLGIRVLATFEQLHEAAIGERKATSLARHVIHRKAVGRLTAQVSYLLIEPLLQGSSHVIGPFMRSVGDVGCLIDSTIDFRSDARNGLLGFCPTPSAHLSIALRALFGGAAVLARHPQLGRVFLNSIYVNLRDRQDGR